MGHGVSLPCADQTQQSRLGVGNWLSLAICAVIPLVGLLPRIAVEGSSGNRRCMRSSRLACAPASQPP
jgi:hypothetical protein